MSDKKKIGLIINPVAGIGGKAGLKGSDGADIVEKARERGARPESHLRARTALEMLTGVKEGVVMHAYAGAMGGELLKEMGFEVEIVGTPEHESSDAEDTINAAALMKESGVELILFAGGDGTARNIFEAVNSSVPVIGIPAGVKIHSAVYAVNPMNAGSVARDFIQGELQEIKEAEVMDIDEDLFRDGVVDAKLYGYMTVPESGHRLQATKSGAKSDDEQLGGIAGYIMDIMEEDTLYIIGPGSTTRSIMMGLELDNTLLGVDVVKNNQLVQADVSEEELWDLVKDEEKVKIVVTIIGGQGSLFGRGNQQISPRILRKVGKDNIHVVATNSKLAALDGEPLLVDTGDAELDQELSGYVQVIVDYAHTSVRKVANGFDN